MLLSFHAPLGLADDLLDVPNNFRVEQALQ